MFIHKKRNFMFIHIPKTGGISARDALWGPKIAPHISASAMRETDPGAFRSNFKFAFVRNHWARFISAYEFLKKGGLNEKWDGQAAERVRQYKNITALLKSNDKVLNWVHFRPQWHWVCDHDGNLLVDFIGKTEEMEEGLNFVALKTGVKPKDLKKLNANPHKHYSKYFNKTSLGLFNERYSKDIEMFDYEYEEL